MQNPNPNNQANENSNPQPNNSNLPNESQQPNNPAVNAAPNNNPAASGNSGNMGNPDPCCYDSSSRNLRTCLGCGKEEATTDLGISCGQGHYLHGEDCLHNYFQHCLSEENWEKLVPIKCPLPECKEELLAEKVIALMTPEEYERYTEAFIYTHKVVNEDEEFLRCPFCKYGVIFTKEKVPLFFFCEGEKCKKMSCNICHKAVQAEESYDEDQYEEDDFGDVGIHFQCDALKDIKKKIEDTIFEGSINKCPHCGYQGQKDDACTHMQCMRCDEEWCYCCGKKQSELDMPEVSYLGHQQDWEENKKRCPLYMEDFHEEDESWPEEGDGAVAMYHKQKTLYLLRKLIEKLDKEELKKALDHFPGLLSGFVLEEIVKFELKPILVERIA